mmetsp:Transcript_7380/g.6628  ORF Transcript_7380/g.6628 Transcript_7380/m.6628 type:complete len:148 (+) Transcript_7380:1436-1879(+)
MMILTYDMTNFRKFLCLSPTWHHLVIEGMDEHFKKVEVDFVLKYYEHLFFKKSYTNSSLIYFGGKTGIRVDRVIQCEVLPNSKQVSKCLRASFKYCYAHKERSLRTQQPSDQKQYFYADYKMDVLKPGAERVVWVHKDEQEYLSQQQ